MADSGPKSLCAVKEIAHNAQFAFDTAGQEHYLEGVVKNGDDKDDAEEGNYCIGQYR